MQRFEARCSVFEYIKCLEFAIKENDKSIEFPKYEELFKETEVTFLFELDDRDYYRLEIQEENSEKFEKEHCVKFVKRSAFRELGPKEMTFVAITGMHLNGWYMKNRYCGCCGNSLVHDSKERMLRCPVCNNMIFPRINPAVIVGVKDKNRILLTKYRDREYKKYALIAGFNEIGESLEDTVRREVMEEAGLKVKNIEYYKSQPWGFADNILMGFFCELDGDSEITMDEDELSVAEWVERGEIPVTLEDVSVTNEMIYSFMIDKSI